MPRLTNPDIAEMTEAAALPRSSGELVFHDPWERRLFSLTIALHAQGRYAWDEFRDHLIEAIAQADHHTRTSTEDSSSPTYYEHWLASFEQVLIDKGMCTPAELQAAYVKAGTQ